MSTRPITTCRHVVELVTEYLDDALSIEERLAFERHVAICPPCRGYFSQLRRIRAAAGELRDDAVPSELRKHVVESFRSAANGGPAR